MSVPLKTNNSQSHFAADRRFHGSQLESLSRPVVAIAGLVFAAITGVVIATDRLYAIAAAGLLALALVVAPLAPALGLGVLIVWVLLSGILTPVVHLHLSAGTITFDKLWVCPVLIMVALQRFPKGDPRTRRVIGALCLFGLVWLVQSFLTPGLTTSNRLSEVVAIALPAATFMVAFRHARDERGLLRLTAAMTFVGALLALIGIAEQRLGFQLARYSGGTVRLQVGLVGAVRITGPYSVPEVYGVTLLACLAATVYWSLIKSGRQRVLGVAAGLLECTAIGFTLFRTFWIGAVIIAVIAFGWRRGRVGRLPLVAIVAVVVAGFAYVQISSTTFGQVRVDNTSDITGRLNIYAVALQEFQRSPVTGVGVGQFVPYQQKLPPTPALVNSRGTLFPHDSFTQVLAEQGLVGFIPLMFVSMALLWVVVSLFRRARRWPDFLLAIVLLSAALSFLLSNLTLDMLPYGQATAIFAALMGAGTGRLDVLLQTSSAPSRIVERTSVRNGERDLVANLLSPKRLR